MATLGSATDLGVRQGSQFLVTVVLARLLTPTDFGTIALIGGSATLAAVAALSVGEVEIAGRFMERRLMRDLAPVWARLVLGLHPLLDRPPLAPRRCDLTLVWPLEAPMIDRARFRLFREVRIESATPEGSDVR